MSHDRFLVYDSQLNNIKEVQLDFKRDGRHIAGVRKPVLNQKFEFYTSYPWGVYVIHYQHLGTDNRWSKWHTTSQFFISMPLTITSPSSGQALWGRSGTISGQATTLGHVQIVRADDRKPLSGVGTLQSGTNWSLGLDESLPPGTHTVQVKHWMTGFTPIYSDNFTFILRPLPSITTPGNNGVIGQKPVVSGTGEPGATVSIYKSGDGQTVYGTATVEGNRSWSTKLIHDLPQGVYKLAAKQSKENSDSGWIDTPLQVKVLGVLSISSPANGEQEQNFTMTGSGGLGNQNVQFEIFTGGGLTSWGVGSVQNNGSWSIALSNLTPGPLRLTASQKLAGIVGFRGTESVYRIRPSVPTITSTLNGETVTLSGTGHKGTGVRMDIHFRSNTTPYLDAPVSAGSWRKVIPPDLLPGNYYIGGRQSVSDGGTGRIYNTGWATDVLVNIPTPVPTSIIVTVSGQRATFKGQGRRWATGEAGVSIFNDGVALAGVPHADIQTNLSWETTATADLAPGHYPRLTARQGVNRQWSADSAIFSMTVASPFPVFSHPPVDTPTGQRPQIKGTAWPGSAIVLKIPGKDDVPLTATNGTFVLNATEDWAPATYTITATAVFGGQTSTVASRTFTVKTPQPAITTAPNAEVDLSPVIEGTGYKGCWVVIYSDVTNQSIGAGRVDQDNRWKVTLVDQVPGNLVYYAFQQEAQTSNNWSDPTTVRTVKVRVPEPSIGVPTQNGKPARESLFSGTGQYPGTVELSIKGQTQPFLKDIDVQPDGTWKAQVTRPVGPVTLEARLRQKTYLGDPLERVVTVVPAVPVIDTPQNSEALGGVLRVSGFGYPGDRIRIDRRGNRFKNLGVVEVTGAKTWSMQVRHDMVADEGITAIAHSPSGEEVSDFTSILIMSLLKPAPKLTEPLAGDWVGIRPQYSGLATPGAAITVASWFNADEVLAPLTTADANGRWAVTGNKVLREEAMRVGVRQTVDGTPSEWFQSERFMVARKTDGFEAPTVQYPLAGQKVGRWPMFSGSGEPGAEVLIVKESSMSTEFGRTRVDREGRWALRSQIELPVATTPYTYSVRQSRDDVFSLWLLPNRSFVVTQVAVAFEKPIIDKPLDNASQVLERQPLFSGRGVPGAELKVYRYSPSTVLAITRVDAEGNWSVRSEVELNVQTAAHQIWAQQNMDGQLSVFSSTTSFKVEEKLDKPEVTSPSPQKAEVSPHAVIRGTALPGGEVRLFESGKPNTVWGRGIADVQGQWVIVTDALPQRDFRMTGRVYKGDLFSPWMTELTLKVLDGG